MAKDKVAPRIDAEDLIDVPGAAKLVFINSKTLFNWLSEGRLRRFKIGRRTLVKKSEVLALVKEA
jgi:excisionase family DNA binding protein